MEGQQKYLQYILSGQGNALMERVAEEMRIASKQNRWIKGLIR